MRIGNATPLAISNLWAELEPQVREAESLEEAAQALSQGLHRRFDESVALARVFCTLPFDALPVASQMFVRSLAEPAGADAELDDSTPVLSLLGTHGDEPIWNHRRNSKDHAGIPLISAAFVEGIPMIAGMLRDLGVPLDWIDNRDASVIQKILGESESLFFVEDASRATDDRGRKIIVAQDFVSTYDVRSVFGIGGAYPLGEILVVVVFSHDQFARSHAANFLPLATLFKSNTLHLVEEGHIFAKR